MSVIKYSHGGGGSATGSRALAKQATTFRNDAEKINVRVRTDAVDRIIALHGPQTLDELFRRIVEETRKPSQDRDSTFHAGIVNETTTSKVYSDFLKPKDGSAYDKSPRMLFRSGQADSVDGRADNSPNKNPAKTPLIKINVLEKKKKEIKKV